MCRECIPTVYRFLLSLCGDERMAEEILSETFYQAYLHIGKFRGECRPETWLCQIAKNTFYREMKKRRRFVEFENINRMESGEDLFEKMSDREQALKIHKHLHDLKEPYREVFMLRVFGELSFKEISDVFNKSESWAKVTFYRAKDKIIMEMEG